MNGAKAPLYKKEKYDAIISCQKLKKEKKNKHLQLFLDKPKIMKNYSHY